MRSPCLRQHWFQSSWWDPRESGPVCVCTRGKPDFGLNHYNRQNRDGSYKHDRSPGLFLLRMLIWTGKLDQLPLEAEARKGKQMRGMRNWSGGRNSVLWLQNLVLGFSDTEILVQFTCIKPFPGLPVWQCLPVSAVFILHTSQGDKAREKPYPAGKNTEQAQVWGEAWAGRGTARHFPSHCPAAQPPVPSPVNPASELCWFSAPFCAQGQPSRQGWTT